QPGCLRESQSDGVPAVDEALATDTPIMMCRSDIERQSGELRRAGHHVGGALQHRAGQAWVEMGARHLLAVGVGVPVGGRIWWSDEVGTEPGQVVIATRFALLAPAPHSARA